MNRKVLLIILIVGALGFGGFYFNQKPQPKLGAIELALEGKTAKEKANIKSRLIADSICPNQEWGPNLPSFRCSPPNAQQGTYTDSKYEITVETKSIGMIEGGVEIIARAWKDGNPIGFSKDGTVEWERFRIFNPPIMVDDPAGTVVRVWTTSEGKAKSRKLREDPKEAIKEALAHTIKVTAKPGNKIIAGKIGNTTSTFYPEAGINQAGQDSVDGMVRQHSVDEVFSTIITDQGAAAAPEAVSDNCAYLNSTATTNQYGQLGRGVFLFDTSAIGTDTVDSATISIDGGDVAKITTGGGIPHVGIATSSPISNSNLISSDYATFETAFNRYHMGSLLISTGTIAISSWNTGSYNDFGFSATGSRLLTIQTASTSKYSLRIYEDLIKASSAPWADSGSNLTGCMFADNAGTTRDPKLVVVHSAAAPAGGGFNSKRKVLLVE